jgi:hypothetical protein
VVVIFLLLTAYFQSARLSLVARHHRPGGPGGRRRRPRPDRTTLNIQSFMGAIMAIGVAVANAILLVTFAERERLSGKSAVEAAIEAARGRLRPILMTSFAMIAGMMPMALGLGEGGEQSAPLGRAVVGGLVAATGATLLLLPAIFALVQGAAETSSVSLHPFDPASAPLHRPATHLRRHRMMITSRTALIGLASLASLAAVAGLAAVGSSLLRRDAPAAPFHLRRRAAARVGRGPPAAARREGVGGAAGPHRGVRADAHPRPRHGLRGARGRGHRQ